jgi:hypothetical protein
MIVRISGEDQYRLADELKGSINDLDAAVIAAVQAGDEEAFGRTFAELLSFVRSRGERLGDDELEGSDLILPPADITIAEASTEFTGEGLIPD